MAVFLVSATLLVSCRFENDMQRARTHATNGSVLVNTRCDPIKYQESGVGMPLLAVIALVRRDADRRRDEREWLMNQIQSGAQSS